MLTKSYLYLFFLSATDLKKTIYLTITMLEPIGQLESKVYLVKAIEWLDKEPGEKSSTVVWTFNDFVAFNWNIVT